MADDGKITIELDADAMQRLGARARAEGVSPEQYAAELVSEGIGIDLYDIPPGSVVSEEELRASIEEQLRKIETGEAELFPHEQVMAEARAILEAAKARKR